MAKILPNDAAGMNEESSPQERQAALGAWFQDLLSAMGEGNGGAAELRPLSGDASFRRYYLSGRGERQRVLVDAPPARERNETFVKVAELFRAGGVHVPRVYGADFKQGFLCLSYLGGSLLWEPLHELQASKRLSEAKELYHRAFDALSRIQRIQDDGAFRLPPYDRQLLGEELELFSQWFCRGLMKLDLAEREAQLLAQCHEQLIVSALRQPQVCTHRDYHSRNLVHREKGELGVLDFQDAVRGPFAYDLVSLLKDCYIQWPGDMVRELALDYAARAQADGIVQGFDDEDFLAAFELMGVQRHLKAIGIFSRLWLRDGKPGYLEDIPRTLEYVREASARHLPLHDFGAWLESRILPSLTERLARAFP